MSTHSVANNLPNQSPWEKCEYEYLENGGASLAVSKTLHNTNC